jgi:hypothetical protein
MSDQVGHSYVTGDWHCWTLLRKTCLTVVHMTITITTTWYLADSKPSETKMWSDCWKDHWILGWITSCNGSSVSETDEGGNEQALLDISQNILRTLHGQCWIPYSRVPPSGRTQRTTRIAKASDTRCYLPKNLASDWLLLRRRYIYTWIVDYTVFFKRIYIYIYIYIYTHTYIHKIYLDKYTRNKTVYGRKTKEWDLCTLFLLFNFEPHRYNCHTTN